MFLTIVQYKHGAIDGIVRSRDPQNSLINYERNMESVSPRKEFKNSRYMLTEIMDTEDG